MSIARARRWQVAPLVSLSLLAGVWGEWRLFHLPAGDAGAYHARVRAVADRLPYRFGEWVGRDVETPPAAVALLRPNVLLGRRFEHAVTGEAATLMIVQCRDARDMGGHYPPRCYPAHGWTQREAQPRRLVAASTTIPTMVYRYTTESVDRYAEIVLYNFFVRPDGAIESGAAGVRRAAVDPRSKVFGAAQVQVVFDPSMSPERRDEVFRMLVAGAFPVIEAIRTGGVT